ncbi:MAG: tetratricopeptide repeat protein [Verrucomicrobiota bacterium]
MRLLLLALFCSVASATAKESRELLTARDALADGLPDVATSRLEQLLTTSRLDPELRSQAQLLLLESLVRQGRFQNALDRLPKNTTSPEVRYWQALALAGNNQNEAAQQILAELANSAPETLRKQALLNSIEISRQQNDPTTALKTLDQLDKTFPPLRPLLRAQILFEQQSYPQALELLTKLESTTPASTLLQAQLHLAIQQPQKALSLLKTLAPSTLPPASKTLSTLALAESHRLLAQPAQAATILLAYLNSHAGDDIPRSIFASLKASAKGPTALTIQEELTRFLQPESLGEDSNPITTAKLETALLLAQLQPNTQNEQLQKLITLAPASRHAHEARLQLAQSLIPSEQSEEARKLLSAVQQSPFPALSAQAADLLARLANPGDATKLFQEATLHPLPSFTETALLNQALSQLKQDPTPSLSRIQNKLQQPENRTLLDIERALALTRHQHPHALAAVNAILDSHPNHSRADEIRLALAKIIAESPNPDLALIQAQFDTINRENLTPESSRRLFFIEHQLASVRGDWSLAVAAGNQHLKQFPTEENRSLVLLRLAEACFHNEDFSRSHFLFNRVVELEPTGNLRDLALLFAARSNLGIPTAEATNSALALLDTLIDEAGPLAQEARLLKARTLFQNLGKAREALTTLASLPGKLIDHPNAALLSAEAHRELGPTDGSEFSKAVTIYEALLKDDRTNYPRSNQIHFLLARTFRESGQPARALDACLRVVNFENLPVGEKLTDWSYYYECGFEALRILEDAKRFRPAYQLALKLAASNGPGAEQAKAHAEQLQLEHLLWE